MNSKKEIFRTRFSVILVLIILSPWILLINKGLQTPNLDLVIPLVILTLLILIISGINYVIENEMLIFRTWSIKNVTINISSIEKIERTYFILASNAGSLKRLAGRTKKGSKIPFFLISPSNEKKFLERLKEINPDIIINVHDKYGFYRFWDWDI